MTEVTASAEPQLRVVHRSAADPLFESARYTFSVESAEGGFEIEVRFAPIFVHLLPMRARGGLARVAERVAQEAVDAGVREAATVTVSPDGVPHVAGLRLTPLAASVWD